MNKHPQRFIYSYIHEHVLVKWENMTQIKLNFIILTEQVSWKLQGLIIFLYIIPIS